MSRWPEEDKSTLCKLWTTGLSGSQIANAMGGRYSRNSIIGQVHRMKLEPRNPNMNRHLGGRRAETEAFIPKPYVPPVLVDEPAPVGPVGDFPDKGLCRAIPGDAGEKFQCCGHTAVNGTKYCEYHHQRYTIKPLANQRRV